MVHELSSRDHTLASHRWLPLWGLLAGLAAGAAWGALARLWMRLLATDAPAFSWSGTLMIVGLFTVTGGLAGAVVGARRRGWVGRPMVLLRLLGIASTLVLSLGQGAVMLPALLLGALAAGRASWRGWVRVALGLAATANLLAVHLLVLPRWPHPAAQLVLASVLGTLVYAGAIAALAQGWVPAAGAGLPHGIGYAVLALPIPAVLITGATPPVTVGVLAAGTGLGLFLWLRRRHRTGDHPGTLRRGSARTRPVRERPGPFRSRVASRGHGEASPRAMATHRW